MSAKRFVLVAIGATLSTLHGATHLVLPGGSIQAKIDAAAPGDIIAISGDTYHGDITVNKAVRLVEVQGEEVILTGNVVFESVVGAPPFEGFTVGSAGKGVVVNATTGLVLKDVVSRGGTGLTINGASTVGVIGGQYETITQNDGEVTITRTYVDDDLIAGSAADKLVVFQSQIGLLVRTQCPKVWIGHSTVQTFYAFGDDGRIVIVDSLIDRRGSSNTDNRFNNAVRIEGNRNWIDIFNCRIVDTHYANAPSSWGAWWGGRDGRAVDVREGGHHIRVYNCYIEMKRRDATAIPTNYGHGSAIFLNVGTTGEIFNNLIEGAAFGLTADYGVRAYNNFFYSPAGSPLVLLERFGVVSVGSSTGDPLFVAGEEPRLQPGSPCIDAGHPDPVYNDLDGTRNDIGPGGGAWFDPDGWTTDKPVVISFDLGPERLQEGVDTEVNLSNGQAVAQP